MRARSRLALVIAWASASALAACTGPDPGTADVRLLDVAAYRAHVHAVLEPSCATLDCHGDPGRPLRLYAETGLREDDSLRSAKAPLTDAEAIANVESAAGLDPEVRADESRVLLKPLAERAGGMHHVGGDIWQTRDDDAYVCVAAWLAGGLDADAQAACSRAAAAVALPPED
ncbi:MAG: hypothetical protein IT379_17060 [Deltaproteobacteria bacterium]|nr:hypothetical protein [Deltaproteobacteria bacterium]